MIKLMFSALFACVMLTCSAYAQKNVTIADLVGTWQGESKCMGTNPYCHDEVVVYHITRSKADPEKVHLSADKIVNKKPEFMGEFDFTLSKNVLTSEFPIPRTGGRGVWSFQVDGDKIAGVLMVYPENEIGRRVSVARVKEPQK